MTRITIAPVVVPPTPAKVFDILWSTSMVTETPTPAAPGRCVITWQAMSQDIELHPKTERIETNQLMRAAQEVPEVGAAFDAFLAAIIPLKNWIEAQETAALEPQTEVPPEPE